MDNSQPVAIFWFRRDLRINDNKGLFQALTSGLKVLPIFIFDTAILRDLPRDDKRVCFIYQAIENINHQLVQYKSSVQIFNGSPSEIFEQLLAEYVIKAVFINHDYEPYANERDLIVKKLLQVRGVELHSFKDQVIFEKGEILKSSGEPYTIFTPYSHRWIEKVKEGTQHLQKYESEKYLINLFSSEEKHFLQLSDIGFRETKGVFKPFTLSKESLVKYDETRNIPHLNSTSRVSVHLRFGTMSVRQLVSQALQLNSVWLNELIWREFFMQILWHFPYVVDQPFKSKYQFINWLNNENDFKNWCTGKTGYPLVDAGMRELNATGFMHNRVRMVTASFLVKHLLINWQWGEAYFAEKLLDFELSSNNGNWQWAAGTGCDAAPYFRIFNPVTQAEKFDPQNIYIKKWLPEFGNVTYPKPIVDHDFSRIRCLETYKSSL
jgi:deoxyribodipyrimidine photo-lyase